MSVYGCISMSHLSGRFNLDEDFNYPGGEERSASILLKAGLHPFRLCYKNSKSGNRKFDFEWSGPGFSKEIYSCLFIIQG